MENSHKVSRSTLVGSLLSIIASLIAICPLALDFILGGYSRNDNGIGLSDFGQNMVNITVLRVIFIILAVLFASISLILKSPSKIVSILLVICIVTTIVLPFLFGNSQSVGGLFGTVFLLIALIGSGIVMIDSFRSRKNL